MISRHVNAPVPDPGVLADCQQAADAATVKAKEVVDRARGVLSAAFRALPSEQVEAGIRRTSPEASRSLDDTANFLASSRIELAAVSKTLRHSRPQPIRITLFGKTKAGKTTLQNALTGGDGHGIGRGRQRSTLKPEDSAWGQFVLTDTPGTAALDGDEDTRLALAAAAHADIVIYLADDDAMREEEVRAALRLRAAGVPLIFALNVKYDLSETFRRNRFLGNSAVAFRPAEIQGHRRRLESICLHLGLPGAELFPVHAQAGFMAGQPEHGGVADALWAASRIGELVAAVDNRLAEGRASVLRMRGILDRATAPIRRAAAELERMAETLHGVSARLADLSERLRRGLEPEIDAIRGEAVSYPQQWLGPVRTEVAAFVEANIEKANVATLWKKRVERFGITPLAEAWRDAVSKRVLAEATEIELDLSWEGSRPDFDPGNLRQRNPTDWKGLARYGGAGLGLAAGIMVLAGFATGGAAFLAISAGGIALTVAGSFLEPRAESLRRAKDRAIEKLMRRLDRTQKELEASLSAWVRDGLEAGISAAQARLDSAADLTSEVARAATRASRNLWSAVDDADGWLLRETIRRLDERAVPHIVRATRSPGVAWKILVDRPIEGDAWHSASLVLGEPLYEVVRGDPPAMVAASLLPAEVPIASVCIADAIGATVAVERNVAQAARGPHGANLVAASRLLAVRIVVLETGENSHAA